MRYPKYLKEEGTIGLVAPSFGCATEPYAGGLASAIKKWKRMGYGSLCGPNCSLDAGVGISNTPQACGAEFMDYYLREDTDVLISCGGGELMCEILDHIDFERLKEGAPKWFMGYSDNTNLTYLLTTLCDTASIYGPCAAAFGMEPWHSSLEDAFAVLTGKQPELHSYPGWEKEGKKDAEHPLEPYNVTEKTRMRLYSGKEPCPEGELLKMEGRLLGGCLDCLVNLLGTKYDKTREFLERYKDDGIIWFLEACEMNPFDVRRAMWRMEAAGWFDYVKGFLIGRPMLYGQEMMGLDHYKGFLEVAGSKAVPVVMDADIGHLPPMMPLITGSVASVRASAEELLIRMKSV